MHLFTLSLAKYERTTHSLLKEPEEFIFFDTKQLLINSAELWEGGGGMRI